MRAAPLTPAQRFHSELSACDPLPRRLGLAVSGGADSLALMLLAHEVQPDGFEVATVDHGLRPENADEAAFVAGLCADRGIAHRTLRCMVEPKGNLQANARTTRYRALAEWVGERELEALATAHHLEDQAETLLMRLNRGAGVRGLAGMLRCSMIPGSLGGSNLPLWRPLLGWHRAELAAIVAAAGIEPVRDPSNHDPRFERTLARTLLAESAWLDPSRIAESAAHLADAEDAIAQQAAIVWEARVSQTAEGYDYRPGVAAPAIELRIVELILESIGHPGGARGKSIARLRATLSAGGTGTLGGIKATAKVMPGQVTSGRVMSGVWRFTRVKPHRGNLS